MHTPSQHPSSQVAITGIGLVSPLGNSLADALARARRGESGIRAYHSEWVDARHEALRVRVGGTVEGFDPASVLEPRYAARHEPAVLYAMAAADQALADTSADLDRARTGCVIGSGLPGAELWHRALHVSYADGRPADIERMTAVAITGNAAAGQLALRHGLRGPSLGLANACASGSTAIAVAADQIRLGRADAMLVGGCESSMRGLMTYASFRDAGMHTTADPVGACAPFAADRRGFVLAEGAAVLLLERLDRARARGAKVWGTIAGAAITNDAYHVISPDPTGEAWARTMTLALAEAGVHPDEVDVVSAHATATPLGDLAETRAIRRVFGARAERIPVSATKSMHGHAFGAAGALELALAVAAMDADIVLPTINLHRRDPGCDLDYVPHVSRPHAAQVLLKNSFGAGGAATCLLVRRDRPAA